MTKRPLIKLKSSWLFNMPCERWCREYAMACKGLTRTLNSARSGLFPEARTRFAIDTAITLLKTELHLKYEYLICSLLLMKW